MVGREPFLLSLPIHMVISLETPSETHPDIVTSQPCGHLLAQSCWHIKLSIRGGRWSRWQGWKPGGGLEDLTVVQVRVHSGWDQSVLEEMEQGEWIRDPSRGEGKIQRA